MDVRDYVFAPLGYTFSGTAIAEKMQAAAEKMNVFSQPLPERSPTFRPLSSPRTGKNIVTVNDE
jgi:hypothetical protein